MIRRRAPIKRGKAPRRVSKRQRARDRDQAKAKPAVDARSGGFCEAVFSSRCEGAATEKHHRNRNRRDNRPVNLLDCCFVCHTEIHAYPDEAYRLGLLVHSWRDPADVAVKRAA